MFQAIEATMEQQRTTLSRLSEKLLSCCDRFTESPPPMSLGPFPSLFAHQNFYAEIHELNLFFRICGHHSRSPQVDAFTSRSPFVETLLQGWQSGSRMAGHPIVPLEAAEAVRSGRALAAIMRVRPLAIAGAGAHGGASGTGR
jgi:hypothetical protein